MDESTWYRYLVLLDGIKNDSGLVVPVERIAYTFHTFSLHDEHVYEPTGDVTFISPNPDTQSLEQGVERMIDAVLHIKVTARVLNVQQAEQLLASTDDTTVVYAGFTRQRNDIQSLIESTR
ncbi:hypothetical protein IPL85_02610 [Candidatus Saccharibacteria bacterium]|nr:MAG: hypothetical protein IPL85_02610 [Candidatus Saccharibacteria bacterium]